MSAETNQDTRATKLAKLVQLCVDADERTEAVHDALDEMVAGNEITSSEYGLLITVLPSTNLYQLRERLALAAEGKLRQRHMSSLLDSLLG